MTYAAGSGRRRTEGPPAAEEVRGGGVRASSGAGRPVGVRRSCGLPFRARPLPCGPKRCDRNGQARGSTRSRCRASLALLGRCLSRSRGERTRRNWRRTLWTSLSDAMEFAKRLERWMAAPPELARTMRYLTGGAKRTQRCCRSAMPWSIRKPPRGRLLRPPMLRQPVLRIALPGRLPWPPRRPTAMRGRWTVGPFGVVDASDRVATQSRRRGRALGLLFRGSTCRHRATIWRGRGQ